jgi:hypothetical protein
VPEAEYLLYCFFDDFEHLAQGEAHKGPTGLRIVVEHRRRSEPSTPARM